MTNKQSLPIICDLNAIPLTQRNTHETSTQALFTTAQATQELDNGYAFQFAATQYEKITHFIASERLCCPFLTFQLNIPPAQAPLWLHITGDSDVKHFLATQISQYAIDTPASH